MSIEIEKLDKHYGNQQVLHQIDFSIQKGEIVGFLGPNGAGKSTLMKVLTTYLKPNAGSAKVNGFNVVSQARAVQKSIGYLPEHNPLYLEQYVKEYLSFQAAVYKVPKSRIAAIIQQTGLEPEAHKRIGELSKGYRQRVGLAAALLHDPQVLILDEPTTGLDPNQLIEIRALIKSIAKDKTILLSTHIMKEVEALCDRVILINKGKIVADKSLEQMRNSQAQTIQVEFDYRVEEQLLKRMTHIANVRSLGDMHYELVFNTQEDQRAAIFDFAQENGLKALQINRMNASLEKLFVDLTSEQ